MLKITKTFSSFSVDDIQAAQKFYEETLGLSVKEIPQGLELRFNKDSWVLVYPKSNHSPATFTVFNFVVDDIEDAVDQMSAKGVQFERYDMKYSKPDEKGIYRRTDEKDIGPSGIAWFKDPAGNILSVQQER